MAWPVLVFDIETIPDMAGWRRLNGVPEGLPADCSDPELFAHWKARRAEHGQSDFMPLHLQRVLCISCVFRNAEGLRVHSFVDRDGASEGKVVQTFSMPSKSTARSWSAGTAVDSICRCCTTAV